MLRWRVTRVAGEQDRYDDPRLGRNVGANQTKAIVARRAPNGRRLYRAADVEKLSLLKALTDHGVAIGTIAGDSIKQLRKRADAMTEIAAAPSPSKIDTVILGDLLRGTMESPGRPLVPTLSPTSSRPSSIRALPP